MRAVKAPQGSEMRCVPTVPMPHPHPQSVWACPSAVLDTLQVGTELLANGAASFATVFLSPVGKRGGGQTRKINIFPNADRWVVSRPRQHTAETMLSPDSGALILGLT